MELLKDKIIKSLSSDIEQMTAAEVYKNKHGLHKKAPTGIGHKLEVKLPDLDDQLDYLHDEHMLESIDRDHPPRVLIAEHEGPTFNIPSKKRTKMCSDEVFKETSKLW